MNEKRLLILGLGNILLSDEGVGVYIINELKKCALPNFIDLVDGGTMGIGLMDVISGYDEVLVVDAVKGDGLPELGFYSLNDLSRKGKGNGLSLHETRFDSVLEIMAALNMKIPKLSILGIRPDRITPLSALSTHCSSMVPHAVDLIMEKIEGWRK